MDASTSSSCYDCKGKEIQALFEAFASVFSVQEIGSSLIFKLLVGEILYQLQGVISKNKLEYGSIN